MEGEVRKGEKGGIIKGKGEEGIQKEIREGGKWEGEEGREEMEKRGKGWTYE